MKESILRNESGVSPVLGFVLVLAIGVTLITNMQINMVPVWNLQEDLDHLEKMTTDFNVLKSNIDNSILAGSVITSPLIMGFRYSPKGIFYNPRETAMVTLDIKEDVWAEVRFNEMLSEGMDDDTSIKNVSGVSLIYSLQGTQTINPFYYEHSLIWRSGYTRNEQNLILNDSLQLLSVRAEDLTLRETGKRIINIYPISQSKNSIIASKVWLRLHTKHADWWAKHIQEKGGKIKLMDTVNDVIIAYFDRMSITMGETIITTQSQKNPENLQPFRLISLSNQNNFLPIEGITTLTAQVQDYYGNSVPNAMVDFSINNTSSTPNNAYLTANLTENTVISGADGKVITQLKTNGPGTYDIDAKVANSSIKTSFVYPAKSQGWSISFKIAPDSYNITGTVSDDFGNLQSGVQLSFASSDGKMSLKTGITSNGTATSNLDTSKTNGIKITNIDNPHTTETTSTITWDTSNTIIITGLIKKADNSSTRIFNSMNIKEIVISNGCVLYGTVPGNYPFQECDNITRSSHSVNLSGLNQSTAYYFIVNASRSGENATSINSTEYMFVTDTPVETIPPASVTDLTNTSGPLYINWAWNDPSDADFDHVELYMDSNPVTTVPKGQQYYNASYLKPNTTHTIHIRTVDINLNKNTTWINLTAYTPSVYDYVFNLSSITFGTVNNFNNARSDSDSGASAQFFEANVPSISDSNNDTNVRSKNDTLGTTASFASMQSASDGGSYATLSEGAMVSIDIPISPTKSPPINGTQINPLPYDPLFLDADDGNIDITQPINRTEQVTLIPNSPGVTGQKAQLLSDTCCSTTITNANKGTSTALIGTELTALSSDDGTTTVVSRAGTNVKDEGISINFTLTGVETVNWIKIRSKFRTTVPTDELRFGMWNYISSAYDSMNTSTATSTMKEFSYNISSTVDKQNYIKQYGNTIYVDVIDWAFGGTLDTISSTYFEAVVNYVPTKYSTGITYAYTIPNPSSSWVNISITDSSYADAATDIFIYNQTSSGWESIRTSTFVGGLLPQPHVNNKVILNPSNYDTGFGIIKFKYEGIDLTTNGNIGVDLLQPHVFYNNYSMNIATNISSIPSDTQYTLQTNYKLGNTNEAGYNMDIWNFASSTWENTQNLSAASWTQNNVTLTSDQISGGQVKTRFTDQTPTGTASGDLFIDYQRIHGFTEGIPAGYHLDITTDTSNIPEANTLPILQLKYTVSGGNFTVLIKNVTTSGWDSVTTLNASGMPYRNITLKQDELLPDGTFPSDVPYVSAINKYYVQVHYIDESPLLNGTLNLDYQRVYSS